MVTLQPYTDGEGRTGTNVIAVKSVNRADADILVLSAHHDSVPAACGASDNATGVAALLFAAEALKDKRFAAGKTLAEAEFNSAEHFNHRRVERRHAARNLNSCRKAVYHRPQGILFHFFLLRRRTQLRPPS